MAKPEWGTKRLCQSCGARFYDMARNPIVCPKCGAAFDIDAATKLKRGRTPPQEPKPKEAPTVEETDAEAEEEAAELDAGETDDEDILENTDDLEEDDEVPVVATTEAAERDV